MKREEHDYPGRNPRTDPLTRQELKRWILDGAWPHHPVAPVMDDKGRHGVIVWRFVAFGGDEDRPVRVYLKGFWDMKTGTLRENFEGVETVDYDTLDDFLNEWRID